MERVVLMNSISFPEKSNEIERLFNSLPQNQLEGIAARDKK
jgi:hypothetical protein